MLPAAYFTSVLNIVMFQSFLFSTDVRYAWYSSPVVKEMSFTGMKAKLAYMLEVKDVMQYLTGQRRMLRGKKVEHVT